MSARAVFCTQQLSNDAWGSEPCANVRAESRYQTCDVGYTRKTVKIDGNGHRPSKRRRGASPRDPGGPAGPSVTPRLRLTSWDPTESTTAPPGTPDIRYAHAR